MSDRPIQKGDMVWVAHRPPCGCIPKKYGGFGEVSEVCTSWTGYWQCGVCYKHFETSQLLARVPNLVRATADTSIGWYLLSMLKRIDPGILSEDIPEKEELLA